MKKVYINYSDIKFKKQQNFASAAAKYLGHFNEIIRFTPNDIDEYFYNKHQHILKQKKGAGYWLWKPYFINQTLSKLSYGDYLFYSDAGAFFLKRVDILINELNKYNQDIMGFELPLIEEQWTKKELFINMECEDEKYYGSNQLLASYFLIKKSLLSERFFQKCLEFACDEYNITDYFSEQIQQSS
ncbi:MAG: hypothetical protein Q8L27_04510, partial [archaeon]|nr:hypothetical protein [archaeon]